MNDFLTLNDLPDLSGQTVLIRGDLDVPLRGGTVTDDTRLRALLPTLQELLASQNCKIIIMGHLGRPNGQPSDEFSLAPVAKHLGALLDSDVQFIDAPLDQASVTIANAPCPSVMMIENTRFYTGEKSNDNKFAQALAKLADIYVNNAFASAHRAHASVEAITHYIPSYAGRLIEAELNALSSALETPKKPVAALVGGAKVSTKLSILNALVSKVDIMILGGGMANTFLYAQGHAVGASLCERDMLDEVQTILATAKAENCEIILPVDVVVAAEFAANAPHKTVLIDAITEDDMALDLGAKSIDLINAKLDNAKTLLWNGPLGAFEIEPFDHATVQVAKHAAELTQDNALVTIAGGGDTLAALEHAGAKNDFSYVSTAGGAFLEYVEGKTLPAIKALTVAKSKAT